MTPMIFTLLLWVAIGAITANLAKKRGRDPYIWFLIVLFLGIFGVLALFILPPIKPAETPNPETTAIIEVEASPESACPCLFKEWFCFNTSKEQLGPMSYTDLKKLWEQEKVIPQSYAWAEGMPSWLPIEQIPDLYDALRGKKT